MSEEDADGDGSSAGGSATETTDGDVAEAELEDIAENPETAPGDALSEVLGGDVEALDEGAAVEPPDALIDRVESADAETLAIELEAFRTRIGALESQLEEREEEVSDLESRLARKQADFQNYKKRQEERLEEEKARATEDLVTRLLDVRDNLARALDQDEDADIRGGVESTLRLLDEEFERENVARIEPEPGEETDPQRHEVLMRVASGEPEGAVADVHRPGYEMAGKVLRAAQVTVSEGPDEDGPDGGEDEGAEDGGAEDEGDE